MAISAPAAGTLDRRRLAAWYLRNRERSASIFSLVDPAAFYERPIQLRHPFAFYEGHLPAFSYLTLNQRALLESPVDERLEHLFERGIDPGTVDAASRHARDDWPSRDAIVQFGRICDERVMRAIATAKLEDELIPRLDRGQAVYTVLEHEPMHHETLMYIIHRLPPHLKGRIRQQHHDAKRVANEMKAVAPGNATLGAAKNDLPFGWDNEFGKEIHAVPGFGIMQYPVTNGDFLAFVNEGGQAPPFWLRRDGEWMLLGAFEELPLPLSWPVYVSHDLAEAYASWRGVRLPTEAEYHRAAYGTPRGDERAFPWGEDAPHTLHGNFDFSRYDPEPVNAHPAGASAWDVHDLIGNGWEWTSTSFAPFAGFEPMASYPQYSADFFDGKHFVMKGASPVTSRDLIRRSFRNWFYGDYPYMYAKFRCVA